MDARLKAANAILERGVRFRLPAPFYKRWLKKDYVTIRHLKAGTILEISSVVLNSKLEEAITLGDYEFLHKAIEPCARCIAIAILNDKRDIEKKAGRLTKRLLWKVSDESMIDIFLKISIMNRVSDFTIITRYLLNQMMTMMSRKNLGQVDDGS
ncbi:MAG TPA: hypothetical protein DEG28_01095 [Porphyromonadaceae bacterium]|nr:hypothetical protein [Porphyromonadaceae bacterium]